MKEMKSIFCLLLECYISQRLMEGLIQGKMSVPNLSVPLIFCTDLTSKQEWFVKSLNLTKEREGERKRGWRKQAQKDKREEKERERERHTCNEFQAAVTYIMFHKFMIHNMIKSRERHA